MNLISIGSLVWLPADSKRWVWDRSKGQLSLFPEVASITKIPMIGVLKGYTNAGDCEVLLPDGVWEVQIRDLYEYSGDKDDRVNTNKKAG